MRRRIFRVIRCNSQRRPSGVRRGVRISVDIAVADCRHRTPETVMIFAIPTADGSVGGSDVEGCKQTGRIGDIQSLGNRQGSERAAVLQPGVVGPKQPDLGLFRRRTLACLHVRRVRTSRDLRASVSGPRWEVENFH